MLPKISPKCKKPKAASSGFGILQRPSRKIHSETMSSNRKRRKSIRREQEKERSVGATSKNHPPK
jgi:hypothetical protein